MRDVIAVGWWGALVLGGYGGVAEGGGDGEEMERKGKEGREGKRGVEGVLDGVGVCKGSEACLICYCCCEGGEKM